MRAVKLQSVDGVAANDSTEVVVIRRYLFPGDELRTIAEDGSLELLRVVRTTKDEVELVLAGRMGVR